MDTNITLIDEKYPEVVYVEGEDLNIENMKKRIIRKAWYDTARYNDVADIAVAVGMGTRTLYTYVRQLNLPRRSGLK
jgi:hypothetical protein